MERTLDPWLNGASLIDIYGWNSLAIFDGCHKKVSMLITKNKWKQQLPNIPTRSIQTVNNITIYNNVKQDFWYWTLNSQGNFTMKSAWKHFRRRHNEYEWAKVIWDKSCAPKMSICYNKLSTKEKISKQSPNIYQSCVLCSNNIKNRDHLFFNYSYSRKLLEELILKFRICTGNNIDLHNILDNIIQAQSNHTSSNQIINIIFTTLIWNTWIGRNSRMFRGIKFSVKLRPKLIIQDSKFLLSHQLRPNKLNSEMILILEELNITADLLSTFRPP